MKQTDFDKLHAASPIATDRLQNEWDSSEAKALIKNELMTMTTRTDPDTAVEDSRGHTPASDIHQVQPSRNRKRIFKLGAVAASVAVISVLSGLNPFSNEEISAVRNLPDGGVVVDWASDFADADAVARQLQTYGIDVKITRLPSSPSAVGTVVSSAIGNEGEAIDHLPEGLSIGPDGSATALQWTFDPETFTGQVTLHVGVTPDEGGAYVVAEEAFEPGEILANRHCSLPTPLMSTDLVETLASLEQIAIWDVITDVDTAAGTYRTDTVTDTVPEGTVISAYAMDTNSIRIQILPEDVAAPIGILEPRLSDYPCP